MQAPEGSPLARQCRTLGTLSLTLAILEIVYCGQKLVLQLLNTRIIAAEKALLPSTPGMSPTIYSDAAVLARRIAPWEAARMAPFIVASVVLLFIAARLRRGDLAALAVARQWAFAALGVVGLSLLIQIVAVVPPTLDYQEHMLHALPSATRKGAPIDIGPVMSSMTIVGTVMGLAMGTVIMSVWPVVLYLWAGRLRREPIPSPQGMTGEP
ncbi:MAG TPA: hypothetical protein VF765_16885 [Polyangiaceae bacterium]